MKTKSILSVGMALTFVLATAIGSQPILSVYARSLPQQTAPSPVTTIPYSGQLTDLAGQAVPAGPYDFYFALYTDETSNEPLWSEVQSGVLVDNGSFHLLLGNGSALSSTVVVAGARWLAVGVRGPGEGEFTPLSPRQMLNTVNERSITAPTGGAACAHDHIGEEWTGTDGLSVELDSTSSEFARALQGIHDGKGDGVRGFSMTGNGVSGEGLRIGVNAYSLGQTHDYPALKVENGNPDKGMAAYMVNQSSYPTAEFDQKGTGTVLDLQNTYPDVSGSTFIKGFDVNNDLRFQFKGDGQGRSDVGWTTPAEDFAEMLPATTGLEPGDVLIIGPDGKLERSSQPYQTSVAGVYSTQPGFLGGQPVEGEVVGEVPLALVGLVPVKVTAENGSIQPGDMLVTSSTPGYAMKAGPNPSQGTVIGKAMEAFAEGAGRIRMLAVLQ